MRRRQLPTQPPKPGQSRFGGRWKAIVSADDDWSEECKSSSTAFESTAPGDSQS